ncbi:MAG: DegV family protein [Dehalococcoidia bacterium]|nr:MAG: DegV family protein [Dehalococcoidia bacterium]
MAIQIVSDSTSDISPELANELGIQIVPGYIRIGKSLYRDGIDINKSGFYRQLLENPLPPVTYEASVEDFVEAYSKYQDTSDGIVSIHISSKLSRMYDSARRGSKKVKASCAIKVMDSSVASIGLGLIVINAAKLANAGESIQHIVNETNKAISQIHMLGLFDTLKYAARGGRVTKNVVELSSIFRIKPILTFRDGEVVVEGLARTYEGGIEELLKFVNNTPGIQDLGIAYSTNYDTAIGLKRRLGSVFPEERIYIEQIGSALGAHCGPNAIFVALRHS